MRLGLILAASLAFAGQSLNITTENGSWPQAARSATLPYRVEFWMHNVGSGPGNQYTLINTGGVSWYMQWNGGTQLWLGATHRTIDTSCTINPSAYGANGFFVRYQYDPSVGSFGQETCEVWGYDSGVRTGSVKAYTGTATNNSTTGQVNGQAANGEFSLGFLRGYSTLVGTNAAPPVPSSTNGDLFNFKFENTLTNDAGTNMTLASPAYSTSPAAVVKASFLAGSPTAGQREWTDSIPWRAGWPGALDSTSVSTSDAGGVTLFWQQVAGPTTLRFSSRTAANVTVSGCIAGQYTIRLTASDSGVTNSKDLDVGCVATDDKGVVVPGDPRVSTIFGDMIALGRNPWTWADERHLTGSRLRSQRYDDYWPVGFSTWQAGTVSWNRSGTCATTLAADITTTTTSISVADASGCDWSSLPVIMEIGSSLFNEWVLITGRSGNTLTVGAYGRNLNTINNAYSAGTPISMTKVIGTSTAFLTALCPGGAGFCGTVLETGTVTMTNGSANITRTAGGGTWVNGSTAPSGLRIRIDDGAGNLYLAVFSATGANTGTGSKTWTGTTGSYAYNILRNDRYFMALEWDDPDLPTNPPTPNGNTMAWRLIGCTSDTACFITEKLEAFGTGAVTGKRYAYHDAIWINGNPGLGPNYYDEIAAHYKLHFRSGLTAPLTAARKLGRWWAKNPELMGGRTGSPPRSVSPVGMFAAAVLDGQSEDWPILRKKVGANWDTNPCNQDLREVAYSQIFNVFAALFDPDDTLRAAHKVELGKMYTFDNNCKGADNSYTNTYTSDQTGVDLTATNGSRDVTGTGIPAGACDTTAGANGSIFNGGTALTGTGFVSGSYIALAGTRSGADWIQFEPMQYNSSTSITLGQAWQGDTCSSNCKWYVFGPSAQYFIVGGLYDRTKYAWPNVDPILSEVYQSNACEWINSGMIRLALPHAGPTGSTFRYGKYNLLGNGTQVYQAGIKAYALSRAAKIDDATLAANYTTLTRAQAQWILNTGVFDPNDGVRQAAIYYARGYDHCEPPVIGTWHPYGCGPDPTLSGEVFSSLVSAYQADNSLKDKIDRLYGSTWGRSGWTTGGVYQSPVALSFPADINFQEQSYFGRQCGMGECDVWPAARLGGVAAAITRNLSLTLTLPAWATDVRVTVTQPSGATTTAVCTVFPCTLNAAGDARQGEEHPVTLEYRNGSGVVLRTGRGIARVQ